MYKLTKYAKRLFHAHLNGQKLSNIDLIALHRMNISWHGISLG